MKQARTANSTYPKGGVSCSADTFVVAESSVLRMKFSGKSPALRVAANRCAQLAYLTLVFCTMNRFINKRDLVLREKNSLISSLSIKIV